MRCIMEDAMLICPRGDVAFGAEQICNLFSDFLESEATNTKHTGCITRISFVTDDVAVVDGDAFIAGVEHFSTTLDHHRFTDILIRSEG